jgi:hypothetical protein
VTLIGSLILLHSFPFVLPFHKKLHALFNDSFETIAEFKAALLKIDARCPELDLSQIVDEYLDSWWSAPLLESNHMAVLDGVPRFIEQICQKVLLDISFHCLFDFNLVYLQTGGTYDHTVAWSFYACLQSDGMLAHFLSMMGSRYVHDAIGDFVFEYVDEEELDRQDVAMDHRMLLTPTPVTP